MKKTDRVKYHNIGIKSKALHTKFKIYSASIDVKNYDCALESLLWKAEQNTELKDRVRELEEKIRVLEIQNENKNVGKRLSLYETIHKKCEYL